MQPVGVLLDVFQVATESWVGNAVDAGQGIFRRLAALELVVFGLIVALKARGATVEAVFPELAWKLFLISLLLTGLLLYPLWVPLITPTFAELAGHITGFSTLNPVVIMAQGIALGLLILASSATNGLLFPDPAGAILGALAAFGIIVCFISIAAVMTKTLIESWIVLAAGPFFLGFSPFRLTAQIADNFIIYAFQVGIRFFFLLLLVSAARNVAIIWAQSILFSGLFNFELIFELLAGSAILAISLWTIPTKIADVLTRNWQLGLRQGLGS